MFKKLCCLSKLKPTLLRSMACQNNGCCSPSYRNLRWVSVYTWDDTPDPDHSDPEWSADHGCPDLPIFRSLFFRQLRGARTLILILTITLPWTKHPIVTLTLIRCCQRYHRKSNCRRSKCRITIFHVMIENTFLSYICRSCNTSVD